MRKRDQPRFSATPPKNGTDLKREAERVRIARDYHKLVKRRLKPLVAFIQLQFGRVAHPCVSGPSAPVMEGLGCTGVGWAGRAAT